MTSPPAEQPYQVPGTRPAWEPATILGWPVTAAQAAPFVQKVVA